MEWVSLLFSTKGRFGRSFFWGFGLAAQMIGGVTSLVGYGLVLLVLGLADGGHPSSATAVLVLLVLLPGCVAWIWASAAIAVKRMHDRGRSGWWLVPIVGTVAALDVSTSLQVIPDPADLAAESALALLRVWLFVDLGCLRGTTGPNRWGEDPLAEGPVVPLWIDDASSRPVDTSRPAS